MTPGATGHGPGTVSWRIGRSTSIVEELTPDLFVVGSRSMVGPGTGGSENRIELVGRGLGAETVEQVAPFGPGRSWVCAQAHHDPRSHWARPRHGVLEDRAWHFDRRGADARSLRRRLEIDGRPRDGRVRESHRARRSWPRGRDGRAGRTVRTRSLLGVRPGPP